MEGLSERLHVTAREGWAHGLPKDAVWLQPRPTEGTAAPARSFLAELCSILELQL